jgi:hypothetical protein
MSLVSDPVHPSPVTYKKIAIGILSLMAPTQSAPLGPAANTLLGDIPEWQWHTPANRFSAGSATNPYKLQRSF